MVAPTNKHDLENTALIDIHQRNKEHGIGYLASCGNRFS